jgi:hypothetical protein
MQLCQTAAGRLVGMYYYYSSAHSKNKKDDGLLRLQHT